MIRVFDLVYPTLLFLVFFDSVCSSQTLPEKGDPPNPEDIPSFYKSTLQDIYDEMAAMKTGKSEKIAISPGGHPLYAVYYGQKENFRTQANYNSAVAARNAAFYAEKNENTRPVVFLLGPVHGQEVEGIVGLVNLIHIAETGRDYRGKEWPELKAYFDQARVVIIPSGNPDGRTRNPYDAYVGVPEDIMTKYGQGTKKDGTYWRWPHA
ncbi:MAG: M14 family zinc carboxypeptidase, partial [Cyclobacteriaceae bacterium]